MKIAKINLYTNEIVETFESENIVWTEKTLSYGNTTITLAGKKYKFIEITEQQD